MATPIGMMLATPSNASTVTGSRADVSQTGARPNPGQVRLAMVDLTQAIESLTKARAGLAAALLLTPGTPRETLLADARAMAVLGARFTREALRRGALKRSKAGSATQLPLKLKRPVSVR